MNRLLIRSDRVVIRSDDYPGSLIPSFFETEESEAGGIRMKRIGAAYRACFRWI